MSIAQSISNIFRPTQQTVQQPQPQGPGPSLPADPARNMQIQNPGATITDPAPTNQTQDNSPLDEFAKLWETDPNAKPPVDPWSQPIFPSDPAKIQEQARKMNMLQGADPALVQKVMAGNDPQALMDLIQFVGQNSLAMAAQLTTATVEKAGVTIRDRERAGLEGRFQEFQSKNLSLEDPILSNPAVRPMLDMARRQIQMKNPNMSPAKVQEEAVKYMRGFATAMNGNDPAIAQQPQLDATNSPVVDWSSFAP